MPPHALFKISLEWTLLFFIFVSNITHSNAYDSKFDLDKAERYVTLSGAAYCTDPQFHKNTVDDWSCNACKSFPNMKAVSFTSHYYDANGFVGYDSDANEIIVAFSGTDPIAIENWIDDIDTVKEDYPYCTDCKVHKGFYDTYKSVSSTIHTLVDSFFADHPTASIATTGHSLGAALAAHYTADFAHMQKLARREQLNVSLTDTGDAAETKTNANSTTVTDISLIGSLQYLSTATISTAYAFGMPRVGEENFENWYKGSSSGIPGTFRVVHHQDPVPHLPPLAFNFHHIPYEVFYVSDYQDYTICSFEGEDPNCSDQYLVDLNLYNHLVYMDFDFTKNWLSCGI